jgi:soluble lytic murein transglycosylase-like protein
LARLFSVQAMIARAETAGHHAHLLRKISPQPVVRGKKKGNAALKAIRHQPRVRLSKIAHGRGVPLIGEGYPIIPLPVANTAEPALVYSLIRQESEFNHRARSWVGARGYMQLMWFTARQEARDLKLRYSTSLLITNPSYNLRLGTAHVSRLLGILDGSYPLVLAAYNAGAHRVKTWLAAHGDPRKSGSIDWPTWIELIVYDETRGYVKRVLEALPVYRYKLKDHIVPSRLLSYWKPPIRNRSADCARLRMKPIGPVEKSKRATGQPKTKKPAAKAALIKLPEKVTGIAKSKKGKRKTIRLTGRRHSKRLSRSRKYRAAATRSATRRQAKALRLISRRPDNIPGNPACR